MCSYLHSATLGLRRRLSSWDLLLRIASVALTAASPIGEILVAIPLGVALGLDPILSYMISLPSNMLPAYMILRVNELIRARFPRLYSYFSGKGSSIISRLGSRRLSMVIIVSTPLAGVYAVSMATSLLGIDRRLSLLYQSIGVALFGLAEAMVIIAIQL